MERCEGHHGQEMMLGCSKEKWDKEPKVEKATHLHKSQGKVQNKETRKGGEGKVTLIIYRKH